LIDSNQNEHAIINQYHRVDTVLVYMRDTLFEKLNGDLNELKEILKVEMTHIILEKDNMRLINCIRM
jgi:hypothetical protein